MRKTLLVLSVAGVLALVFTGTSALAAGHSDHGCSNCHVPHKASKDPNDYGVPLWSTAQTKDGLPVFDLYSSPTLDATVEQPNGPSKLCLGCHDGSYYVFGFLGKGRVFDNGQGNKGEMSLATSHPISFEYTTALATKDGGLFDPATAPSNLPGGGTIQERLLDPYDRMQCTSCHDVHSSGIGEDLLLYDITASSLKDAVMCQVCHDK